MAAGALGAETGAGIAVTMGASDGLGILGEASADLDSTFAGAAGSALTRTGSGFAGAGLGSSRVLGTGLGSSTGLGPGAGSCSVTGLAVADAAVTSGCRPGANGEMGFAGAVDTAASCFRAVGGETEEALGPPTTVGKLTEARMRGEPEGDVDGDSGGGDVEVGLAGGQTVVCCRLDSDFHGRTPVEKRAGAGFGSGEAVVLCGSGGHLAASLDGVLCSEVVAINIGVFADLEPGKKGKKKNAIE